MSQAAVESQHAPRGHSGEHDARDNVLTARLDNARKFASVLRAINFRDVALCTISASGIRFTVEDQSKCVQAHALLQSGLFQLYSFQGSGISFCINISILLECLSIFGSGTSAASSGNSTALRICYDGYGSPLVLVLEEQGVVTDCEIRTLEPEEITDFRFIASDTMCKIIIQSEALKEAFSELDMTSEVLQMMVSPDKPHLRLSTYGAGAHIHVDYQRDSDVVELFECTQIQINRYRLTLLQPCVRALAISSKTSIRTNARGFLSMRYMMEVDGQISFVEYLCAPEAINDEDEQQPSQ